MKNECILLAYSGGLDTSAIIPWLREAYGSRVIAYCCDLGNAPDETELRERALALGADELVFEDVKQRFADQFVFPLLRSGATYYDDYLLGTAIARPLIAERMAHWARKLGVKAIAHGATGKGNDHLRFERAWSYLAPELEVIAPWKTWDFKGRSDLQAYLSGLGYPWSDDAKEFSVDVNLLHRSCEGGVLERIDLPYPASRVLAWTEGAVSAASRSSSVEIEFAHGNPIALDSQALAGHELIARLNNRGALHGIGVADLVEERTNGLKSRGIYETPGGTLLLAAYRALKQICWSRALYQSAQRAANDYGMLVYDGAWFSDARFALEGFMKEATRSLDGKVRLELQGASVRIASRTSPFALYDPHGVSFESDSMSYNEASRGYTLFMTEPLRKQGQASGKRALE
jgi:argininosuccinate synthase